MLSRLLNIAPTVELLSMPEESVKIETKIWEVFGAQSCPTSLNCYTQQLDKASTKFVKQIQILSTIFRLTDHMYAHWSKSSSTLWSNSWQC